jgi:hypothetical protein
MTQVTRQLLCESDGGRNLKGAARKGLTSRSDVYMAAVCLLAAPDNPRHDVWW